MELVCLSLWQPWATLVADGFKRVETRHWSASYRGLLAIHAAKKWDERFSWIGRTIQEAEILGKFQIPTESRENALREQGKVIAVATLENTFPYETQEEFERDRDLHLCPPTWWKPPQYGFLLRHVRRIEPVSVRGHMGLFTVHIDVKYLDKEKVQ